MRHIQLLAGLALLAIFLAACGGSPGPASGGYQTDFPMPTSVTNFTDLGNGTVNFQTTMTIGESVGFYRDALSAAGLSERAITTSITETTFSMVFDGHSSGRAVVVQGVDLGDGTTNINLRFEDV